MKDLRDQFIELDDNMLEHVSGGWDFTSIEDIPEDFVLEFESFAEKETSSFRAFDFASLVEAANNVAGAASGK